MKKIVYMGILAGMLLLLFGSCSKDNFIKTGLSNGKYDGNMLEYMRAPGHSYDWDSTVLLIERAGLVDLFEGKTYEQITFFGPTNHSIRRWMIRKAYTRIQDLDPTLCREILLRHVIVGKYMREEIPLGKGSVDVNNPIGEGGAVFTTLEGNRIWAYTFRDAWNKVPETGALSLYMTSVDKKKKINIASTDIEPNNGVVHSLHYDFTLEEM